MPLPPFPTASGGFTSARATVSHSIADRSSDAKSGPDDEDEDADEEDAEEAAVAASRAQELLESLEGSGGTGKKWDPVSKTWLSDTPKDGDYWRDH